MSILSKIKSFFTGREPNEIKDDSKPVSETIETIQAENRLCFLCNQNILPEDRTRDLNGVLVHKRCAKKAVKNVLNGKSIMEENGTTKS